MAAIDSEEVLRTAIEAIEARGLRLAALRDPDQHALVVGRLLKVLMDFKVPFTIQADCTEGYEGLVSVKVGNGRESSNADVHDKVPGDTGLVLALIRAIVRAELNFKRPV